MKNLILVFESTWSTHLHEMNIGCLDEWLNEVFWYRTGPGDPIYRVFTAVNFPMCWLKGQQEGGQ